MDYIYSKAMLPSYSENSIECLSNNQSMSEPTLSPPDEEPPFGLLLPESAAEPPEVVGALAFCPITSRL